jgi:hypothetical protein
MGVKRGRMGLSEQGLVLAMDSSQTRIGNWEYVGDLYGRNRDAETQQLVEFARGEGM